VDYVRRVALRERVAATGPPHVTGDRVLAEHRADMEVVALSIPIDRQLRTRAELIALVEAIRDAPTSEPETDALEWKCGLDLGSTQRARFQVAKHVLGFGNRSQASALRSFDGCAYLLLGVEPGRLEGCPAWDPANLDGWIGRYVSPGFPRWHPEYLRVDGADVLVCVVEPPRPGDAICTLQRAFEGFAAGRIFVRRGGRTDEADPAAVRALEARLRAVAPELRVDVALAEGAIVQPIACRRGAFQAWRDHEARRYERALRAHGVESGNPVFRSTRLFDNRSPQDYLDEVRAYLDRSERRWTALSQRTAIASGEGRLVFELRNPTRGNWERVQLEVSIPGYVRVFLDEGEPLEVLQAPEPPEEFGKQLAPVFQHQLPVEPLGDYDEIKRRDDRTIVRFAPRHLRPGSVSQLEPVYLLADESRAGHELSVHWRVTSTSASGWVEDAITLRIGEDVFDATPAFESD